MDLERDISQLRVQYRDAHPETLQAVLEQADQHLIQDFTDLAHWAQDLQEQGDQLDLQMHYRILKAEQSPSLIQGITIIPLELQISSRNDRSGYQDIFAVFARLGAIRTSHHSSRSHRQG